MVFPGHGCESSHMLMNNFRCEKFIPWLISSAAHFTSSVFELSRPQAEAVQFQGVPSEVVFWAMSTFVLICFPC